MGKSICVRKLSSEEREFLCQTKYGIGASSLKSIAIMGLDQCLAFKERIDTEYEQYVDHVGDNNNITRSRLIKGGEPVTDTKKIAIAWGSETPLLYLEGVAKELNIPFFYTTSKLDIIYFEDIYMDRFLQAFNFADQAFSNREKGSFFSSLLGKPAPDWNSQEAKIIRAGIRKILMSE